MTGSQGDRVIQFPHGIKLLFNRLGQFDLRAAAVKVMFFPVDLEINIAGKVVRQESHTDFQSDQFTGEAFCTMLTVV